MRKKMNVADYLLQDTNDDRIAIVEPSGATTYSRLKSDAARLAGELAARGAGAGDRIGILGANSAFWVASYLAARFCLIVPWRFASLSTVWVAWFESLMVLPLSVNLFYITRITYLAKMGTSISSLPTN
jgi:hypothetical protein